MLNGLSWLYGKIIDSRNSLYARGILKSVRLPAKTISVGNITVGGTGKTPLVAYLSRLLAGQGETVCVISRGYKRNDESKRVLVSDLNNILSDPDEAGDEPFELATELLGRAIIVADRNRVAAGEWAHRKFGITAFVLDDAFQHLKVERDVDIVVIDATNAFGNFKQLPAGILRESAENITRADVAVLTRTNLCADIERIKSQISRIAPELPVFEGHNETTGFKSLTDFAKGIQSAKTTIEKKALAFCGIGNPQNFFDQLAKDGIVLTNEIEFEDHHVYSSSDIEKLERSANETGAEILITTAKDAVKLDVDHHRLPCYVCETKIEFKDKEGFADFLAKAFVS